MYIYICMYVYVYVYVCTLIYIKLFMHLFRSNERHAYKYTGNRIII